MHTFGFCGGDICHFQETKRRIITYSSYIWFYLDAIQAILLAIIEGITEFLPISSTGHMVLGSSLMGIASDPFVKLFTVAIQFGAILSVLVLYAPRFLKSIKFYMILLIAFIPAAIAGKLFNDLIDQLLESVTTIGITLLVGGVVLVYIDR